MKPGWVVALLVVGALGGCAAGGGNPQNPNLLAPKLVVHPRADGGAILYVHGAFREQVYDWIRVAIDNETVDNRSTVFSFETVVPTQAFFLDVEAGAGESVYRARARLDLDVENDRVLVATLEDDGWSDARASSLPYEDILDRVRVSA